MEEKKLVFTFDGEDYKIDMKNISALDLVKAGSYMIGHALIAIMNHESEDTLEVKKESAKYLLYNTFSLLEKHYIDNFEEIKKDMGEIKENAKFN